MSKATQPQRKRTARRQMSASEARSFGRFSVGNASMVLSATTTRGCSCDPYADVFTFNRWRAQGFSVQRGEHAIAQLPVIVQIEPSEGEEQTAPKNDRIFTTSSVFCRCQVAAL